jgi:eukaryotic-like serine/threonine-protein kinase
MLDDKYRIERLLAVGGMGAVYVGTHIKLRKRVAIKVLNPQLSSAPMIERFHREAITASQIGHEGIAQVTDLGTSSDGEPFLVMEYLEGESLASRLRASGPLPVEDACELGCSILSPLSAAHRAGIVHRDLKPDNVYLVRQSRGEMVKLLDFGISRTAGHDSEFRLTTTGLVLGTPYYMSPEQARGDSVITPAADLYAFGVMLYEMLVGTVPIQAENYNQLMYRVMIGDYAKPRERRPDLPPLLETILLHAMAIVPEDRPASALELEHMLLPFCRPQFRDRATGQMSSTGLPLQPPSSSLRGIPSGIDRTMLADSQATPDPRSAATVPEGPRARSPRRRWPRLLGVVLALGGVGGVVAAVVAGQGEELRPVEVKRGPAPAVPGVAPPVVTPPAVAPVVVAEPTPAAQAPVAEPAPPAPSEPATITLRFEVDPAGAAITLDGTHVAGHELAVAKDSATHALRITAPGRIAHDETVRFDESQRLVVQLKRTADPVRDKPHKEHPNERIDSQSPYD